jgi:hypothetical protein
MNCVALLGVYAQRYSVDPCRAGFVCAALLGWY